MKKIIRLLIFSCLMLAGTPLLQAHPQNDVPASAGVSVDRPSGYTYETIGSISAQDVCVNPAYSFIMYAGGYSGIINTCGELCSRQYISAPECTVILLDNSRNNMYRYSCVYSYSPPYLHALQVNSIKV